MAPWSQDSHDAGRALGRRTWVFSAGFAPSQSTGFEPEFTSRNTLCLLNTGQKATCVKLKVYYEEAEPVGPYEILVAAQRVKHQRINDLIEPEAVYLDQPYGLVVESDEPIVAQLYYLDSRNGQLTVSHLNPSALP
ncbi:sensory rhodopsin transducer [Nesterenkonia natronophila]|uniref:Sensory rhodopsin transducer n=1 Tax=Nesterenkonia natronophila TaxID=2174932 RepID=A0A3A4EZD5_9MICC|nr:sensory rhodopsin transducer [Nesterenkonia natronophila]RJN31243.1 sensory rhodopsin transducer [Nesterenkonia natronophila]